MRTPALFALIILFTTSFCCAHQANATSTRSSSSSATLASDIRASALWDGRTSVDFHAINYPRMVKAKDAHFLIDKEYVLGITSNGESRAYPTRFASWHHIINDKIGKSDHGGPTFVAVTYCIVCNSGIRFDTTLPNKKPLIFDFYGLYNGVMTMYDMDTKSVWLQVSGRAVKGPHLGNTLKCGPLLDTTWGEWKRLHPDTLVMAPDPQFADCYERKGSVMVRGYTAFPASYFRPTLTHRDTRLPMFDSILAVSAPAMEDCSSPQAPSPSVVRSRTLYRAYPMKAFKGKTGVINDVMGATPVAVFFLSETETMTAVSRLVDGQILTFNVRKTPKGTYFFCDQETGTEWNVEGKGVQGPLTGKELLRVNNHMSQWYGWVSYFPQTTIYGQNTAIGQPTALTAAATASTTR